MSKSGLLIAAALIASPLTMSAQSIDTDSDAFGDAVRAYLLENPEVIFEAVDVYNQRQEVAAREAATATLTESADKIFDEEYAIVLGNPDGDVTVIEFSDYNCGYCKRSHTEIDKLIAADSNVKVIVQQLPIFGGEPSFQAAQVVMAVEAAIGREAAYDLHRAIFENSGQWDGAAALDLADSLGFDRDLIETAMEDRRAVLVAAISENINLGQSLGFQGTPGFVIGDQILPGYAPADAMGQIVDETRKQNNS